MLNVPFVGHVVERLHVCLREVFDVDEEALLAAVAVDAQRLAAHAALHERGHHAVVSHARAVRDAVAQDRVRASVERVVVATRHLGRHLRRDVEVTIGVRVEHGVLVDDFAGRRGVHPHGRREDDSSGLGAASSLEHSGGAERVDLDRERRVGDDVVDVGDRGEVEDDVGARRARWSGRRCRARRPAPTRRRRGAAASGRARARCSPRREARRRRVSR